MAPIERFTPERPIYLNEANTGYKTKVQVIEAIEKLRSAKYLCCYGEKSRPFHMSFNDPREFAKFKKIAKDLNVTLKEPLIKYEEIEELEAEEVAGQSMPDAVATSSNQDPDGKIHIE